MSGPSAVNTVLDSCCLCGFVFVDKKRKRSITGEFAEIFANVCGFGKRLTFQILPPLCKCLKSIGHNFPLSPLVVIVSPLLSIMEDQVKWLRSRGFASAYIRESNGKDRNSIDGQGNFNFVYGSPESLAGDSRLRDMFS